MKKIFTIITHATLSVFTFAVMMITHAFANTGSGNNSLTFKNPLGEGSSIPLLISKLLDAVVKLGTVAAVFMIIYTGFLFVKAQGKPEEITKAKNSFLWTVIGAVIIIGAQVISQVVCNTAAGIGAAGAC